MSAKSEKLRRITCWIAAALAAASLVAGVAVALDRRGSEAPGVVGDTGGRWFCPAKSLGAEPGASVGASCSAVVVP